MSISELLPILDRNNIPYAIAEAGGGNTMMYVAIGAVVVGVWLVNQARRKKQSAEEKDREEEKP